MKFLIPLSLTLLSAVSALPASTSDPKRILPWSWQYEIVSLKGPGCPEIDPSATYQTRPTFGSNTVDGSEIYYWFFAYPYFKASVGGDVSKATVWCETTLQYTEFNKSKGMEASADYRLKLHKNGTAMIAVYDLEEGVKANWAFTYYPEDGDEVVDQLTVQGPYNTSGRQVELFVPVLKNSKQWALPKCGGGQYIKFRTQLTVTSKEGAKGTVTSESYKGEYYGAQQGVSYDWEEC